MNNKIKLAFIGALSLTLGANSMQAAGGIETTGFALKHVEQQRKVKINVSDANGPLIGANVVVKGTTNGNITDLDGNAIIENVPKDGIVIVSYIGYMTKEIPVLGKTSLNVILSEDSESLEEVVVVGFGTARKKDITGAVARVDATKFSLQANTSPIEMLRGSVSGVNASISDPRPGANNAINIRGNRSLEGSNSALIVVDGMIYNGNLSDISTSDIESIDILKDVSSSAIYGSRGANGVIMVTTKKGKTEKPTINVNSYWGFQDYASKLEMESPEEYLDKRRMYINMQRYRGLTTAEDPDNPKTFLTEYEYEMYEKGQTVNGLDLIKQNSLIQNYDLSVSGRTEKTNYYLSGNFGVNNGIIKGDNYKHYSFRSNIETHVTDWFKVGVQAAFSGRDQSGNPADRKSATILSPYGKIYHDDGELTIAPMFSDNGRANPLMPLRTDSYRLNQQLLGNFSAELKLPFLEGFSYTINWMNRINIGRDYAFTPEYKRDGTNQEASASKTESNNYDYTLDNIVKYSRTFGVHAFDITALYSYTRNTYNQTKNTADTFPLDVLGYNNMQMAENQYAYSAANASVEIGIMGRINYRLMDRYLLTATFRRDGASKFARNKRWANFPSVALGWVLSEEDFIKQISWIDMLKARLSWGMAGNQYSGLYDALSLVGSGMVYINGDGDGTDSLLGVWTNNMANDNLSWETTKSINAGIDFAFLKNRISGSLEYFNSRTTDLLVNRNIPIMSGYGSVKTNMGQINSWGIDLNLRGEIIRTKDWAWNVGLTWSLNRNKIVSLYGIDSDGDGREDDDISNNRFIGESINTVYGYEFLGIIQEGEEYLSSLYKPGYAKFANLDGDNEITANDRKILGTSTPDWTGGVSTDLTYKNISLSAFFNIRKGGLKSNAFYNPNNYISSRYWAPKIDWWTPENPSNEFVSIDYPQGGTYPGTFYQECTYVRLQDLTLSYQLPEKWLSKVGISNFRVYASGKNLLTFTDWFGWDPEPSDATAAAFPLIRTFTFGVNFSF